jgi:hypothetical protein
MVIVHHNHPRLFRVLPALFSVVKCLDASFSLVGSKRWNTPQFAALYLCCGTEALRAIAREFYNEGRFELDDLAEERRPVVVELFWEGPVVDVFTGSAIQPLVAIPDSYPYINPAASRRADNRRALVRPVGGWRSNPMVHADIVPHAVTQTLAETWHDQPDVDGVVCRSASIARTTQTTAWPARCDDDGHGEVAVFVEKLQAPLTPDNVTKFLDWADWAQSA